MARRKEAPAPPTFTAEVGLGNTHTGWSRNEDYPALTSLAVRVGRVGIIIRDGKVEVTQDPPCTIQTPSLHNLSADMFFGRQTCQRVTFSTTDD